MSQQDGLKSEQKQIKFSVKSNATAWPVGDLRLQKVKWVFYKLSYVLGYSLMMFSRKKKSLPSRWLSYQPLHVGFNYWLMVSGFGLFLAFCLPYYCFLSIICLSVCFCLSPFFPAFVIIHITVIWMLLRLASRCLSAEKDIIYIKATNKMQRNTENINSECCQTWWKWHHMIDLCDIQ